MLFDSSQHPLSPALAEERRLLGDLRELLARRGGPSEPLGTLRQALADLDQLFLLVVVGEFNSGKSALINVLLGEQVLPEGVTPTTAAVTRVTYGERPERVDATDGVLEVRHPLPLLRELALVDTPGTNAIVRQHQELTERFIPRSDLVLFVTSADRPFTESERAFLEQIRSWGKKIVIVLNKRDLLTGPAELEAQLGFIRESSQRLLGLDPPMYAVSARLAHAAQAAAEAEPERSQALLRASGLGELQAHLKATLDDSGRLRLKLLSALGVAERLAQEYRQALDRRVVLLEGDREAARAVRRHLAQHADERRQEFELRLGRLDQILHDMSGRGERFFEDTIRLGRVFDLLNADKVRGDFERQVLADVPQRVEDLAQQLIDWLVDQDQQLWQWVTKELQKRDAVAPDSTRGRLEAPFSEGRRAVLQTLMRTTRDVLRRHDQRREAEQLAGALRDTVTRAGLVEAGALGLGAITVAIVGSAAADLTGLAAAGALAGLGLYLLPLKRRRVERQFHERTDELRQTLATALRQEFEGFLSASVARVRNALAPYETFVESELDTLEADAEEHNRLAAGLNGLRLEIDTASSGPRATGPQPAASS